MPAGDDLVPEFFPLFQTVAEALIAYTPEHFRSAFCVADQAPQHGEGRLKYRIGCVDYPQEETNAPSSDLHEAVYQIYRYWTKDQQPFPGIEATIELQPDGNWKSSVRQLEPQARRRSDEEEDQLWQAVYAKRERGFHELFGPLPNDIQKLMNLTGIWPGGGLFNIEAARRSDMGVCTSFGLSNHDMPTKLAISEYEQADDEHGRLVQFSTHLEGRTPRWVADDKAGYGYEVMILTPKLESWPLLPISWLVQMEILKDIDLAARIDKYQGMTLESVNIGDGSKSTDFFVESALLPLPDTMELPNGTMRLLVATRITREEMNFSLKEGRPALRDRLTKAGVGQVSILDRPSVV